MQSTNVFFTNDIVNKFAIHRELTGDEFTYQKIKEGSKLIKKTLRLKANALKQFTDKGEKAEAQI
jgi:hypothetical protein